MKFKIGEIAILVTQLTGLGRASDVLPGIEVKVIALNMFCDAFGRTFDYKIDAGMGYPTYCNTCDLRKIYPPEEPAETEWQEEFERWITPKVTA